MVEITSIQVTKELKDKLETMKEHPRATMEDVIRLAIGMESIHTQKGKESDKSVEDNTEDNEQK